MAVVDGSGTETLATWASVNWNSAALLWTKSNVSDVMPCQVSVELSGFVLPANVSVVPFHACPGLMATLDGAAEKFVTDSSHVFRSAKPCENVTGEENVITKR